MECSVDGCQKIAKAARGYCHAHYRRLLLYGDPSVSHSRKLDLAGKKFGHWRVISEAERRVYRNKDGKLRGTMSRFLVRCRCGNERIVLGTYLVQKGRLSCKCTYNPLLVPKDKYSLVRWRQENPELASEASRQGGVKGGQISGARIREAFKNYKPNIR
jgi:hypothetical protein